MLIKLAPSWKTFTILHLLRSYVSLMVLISCSIHRCVKHVYTLPIRLSPISTIPALYGQLNSFTDCFHSPRISACSMVILNVRHGSTCVTFFAFYKRMDAFWINIAIVRLAVDKHPFTVTERARFKFYIFKLHFLLTSSQSFRHREIFLNAACSVL